MNPTPRRILVVCTRRLGDVLLSTPLVRSVKRAWPGAAVDMLVFRGTEAILAGNPDIDAVLTVGERDTVADRLRTFRAIWRRYDIAFSTQTSDRTTLYAWAAGRRVFGLLDPVRAPAWKRALLDAWAPFDDLNTHSVVQGLALCDLAGIQRHYEVVVGQRVEDMAAAREAAGFDLRQQAYALLHVSPKFAYKSWTVAGWAALADRLSQRGVRPVLCAGPAADERELASRVVAVADQAVADVSGRLSLTGLATLARHARVVVGTDTAVTHLAAATGVPTVALFGPSNPVKWGPWPFGCDSTPSPWQMRGTQRVGNVTLVQGEAAEGCVPCRLEGCDRHVNSLSRCLQELPPARVMAAIEALLRSTAPP
ncbi:MAG: glycosyltransferase family 9 protein [Burkholderiales bacterium]